MARLHNFSAGPAALPDLVIQRMAEELPDWQGLGSSVMEVSHRGKDFVKLQETLLAKWRALFAIPQEYELITLSGGATAQFATIPLNLAAGKRTASYLISGHWSRKAAQLAENYLQVAVAHDAGAQPTTIAAPAQWRVDPAAAYFHYCHNETVDGLALANPPTREEAQGLPIVTDISSCIGGYALDFAQWDLAYACAQKNLGIAGVTLVVIHRDLLRRAPQPSCPSVLNYGAQLKAGSLLNTPVTFALYVCDLVCDWMQEQGGVAKLGEMNRQKAQLLYAAIDASEGFYTAPIAAPHRSIMNVVFDLTNKDLVAEFLRQSEDEGLLYLKGHRARGGMRASIYNGVDVKAVTDLVAFMRAFARRYA